MPRSEPRSLVDTDLFDYGPERSRLLLRLWRVLARGRPLGATDVESAARVFPECPPASVHGRGVTLSTWCALDTLFPPAMLDAVAKVESASPVTDKIVPLTVPSSGVSDLLVEDAVVSLPVLGADEVDMWSTEGSWSAFCNRIYFFDDEGEAEQWCARRREMEIVAVDAAWRHIMETWGKVLSHADPRSAGSFAEVRP